jgi:hypothetical protein
MSHPVFDAIDEYMTTRRSALHHHQCPACGEIWSHRASDFDSQEDHTKGHTCPKGCARSYWKCDERGRLL